MTGIMNQVESDGVAAFGADTDDLLLKLAVAGSNLQQKEIRFFHQDGLKPLLIPPQDLVVCDVPVGIYPDEKRAKAFELGAIGERAYTHFLFIEQGLNALKEAGYLLYLIPNRLFQDDTDHLFYRYVQEHAYVLALLQLPHSLFRNQMAARSVLLMQKQGDGAEKPEQVLLAEVPSFSSLEGMRRFMQEMDDWFMHRLQFRR
jgi:site-specific DNA-methyltransferase (adenine-specific)